MASHPKVRSAIASVESYPKIKTARRPKNPPKLTESYQCTPHRAPKLRQHKRFAELFQKRPVPLELKPSTNYIL